ncbi:MAG TPA: HNH endonuclease signature motif containing protein [Gammaproteobacteria bacterium]|nr:HNH endonuclease signature motif containing protein [Gammaproteobacteria bacterium]
MVKLINFFEMPHFNQLRHEMQAPEAVRFKTNTEIRLLDEDSIRRLGQDGIEIELEEIKTLKDKTLSYKGQRVLVYIRDVSKYRHEIRLPRFHISYCKTLEEMTNIGRWARYVVSHRDDGYFQVCINNSDYKSEILNVCQFCLETLNWSDFSIHRLRTSERKKIVMTFSISDFFIKYPKSLFSITPTYTSDTAPSNAYTNDWPIISERLKEEREYRCDSASCAITLSGKDKRYLHVHHKNGVRNDNSKSNLEVLCIRCHAKEPLHVHMKSMPAYKEFILKFGS